MAEIGVERCVEEGTEIILENVNSVQKEFNKELRSDAPETHSDFDLIFMDPGLFYRNSSLSQFGYSKMVEEVIWEYLELQIGPQDQRPVMKPIDFDWHKDDIEKFGGRYLRKKDLVVLNYLPESVLDRIEGQIKKAVSDEELARYIGEVPRAYNDLVGLTPSKNTIKETIAHEKTHKFLSKNTKLGELLENNLDADLGDIDSGKLLEDSNSMRMRDQAVAVTRNDAILTLEEAFCHAVSNTYLGTKEREEIRERILTFDGYDRPESIVWMSELIEFESESQSKESRVDWIRKQGIETLDYIAEKGQVDSKGNNFDPVLRGLNKLLNRENQEKIEKTVKLFEKIFAGEKNLPETFYGDRIRIRILSSIMTEGIEEKTHDLDRLVETSIMKQESILEKLRADRIIDKKEFSKHARQIEEIAR